MSRCRVRFKGQDYLCIGDPPHEGAIATEEQYENFEIGFAHLFSDGKIRRFNQVIGSREDLTWLDDPPKS